MRIAASLFLALSLAAVSAPTASAGVVGFVDDTCDNLSPQIECLLSCQELFVQLATCYKVDSIAFPPGTDLLEDADGDGVPDFLEEVLCGSQIQRQVIGSTGHASCATSEDLVLAPDTSLVTFLVGLVLDTVDDARDLVDLDRDLVPDELEPWLCLVENQNFPEDGSCTGTDYHPPV